MHLLKISDLTRDDMNALLARAATLKERHKKGIPYNPLRGKTLGLIFEKSSTRTRVSFETAMYQLGGDAIFMSSRDAQLGRGEPIKDTARVMSRYVDALVVRTFGHEIIEEYASYSDVPVVNGLTDAHHPCQVLADLLTIMERRGTCDGMTVAWVGDGNNMANSWIEAASILGFTLKLACPKGYDPDPDLMRHAGSEGAGTVELAPTPAEAVKDADVINTDVWASMGQEEEADERTRAFDGFQVNDELLSGAAKDAFVLHCLPAHRGEEITDEVMEGPRSAVWDQAENRLHLQKALLERFLVTRTTE